MVLSGKWKALSGKVKHRFIGGPVHLGAGRSQTSPGATHGRRNLHCRILSVGGLSVVVQLLGPFMGVNFCIKGPVPECCLGSRLLLVSREWDILLDYARNKRLFICWLPVIKQILIFSQARHMLHQWRLLSRVLQQQERCAKMDLRGRLAAAAAACVRACVVGARGRGGRWGASACCARGIYLLFSSGFPHF